MSIPTSSSPDTTTKSENNNPGFFWNLGVFVLRVVVSVAGLLYQAWVLQVIWAWFIVVPFGVAPLAFPAAIGIFMVRNYLELNGVQIKITKYLEGKIDPMFNAVVSWMDPFIIGTVCLVISAGWHYIVMPLLGLG